MTRPARESVLAPGIAAVRHNWRPFVVIQAVAAGLAALYYASPTVQEATLSIQQVKLAGGTAFAAVTTAIAGAILPEIAKRATMGERTPARDIVFQLAFFATIGMLVDTFYGLLGGLFGTQVTLQTVLQKALFDQFVFSPLVTISFSTLAFGWKESGFDLRQTGETFANGGFARRYAPLLVTCWAFWLPVLLIVFALPANLQFLMFVCTQAAWSLLLLHMTARAPSSSAPSQQSPPSQGAN